MSARGGTKPLTAPGGWPSGGTNPIQAAQAHAVSGSTELQLSVLSEGGEPVLGNTVIAVQHLLTGQTWRGLRYRRALRAYVFRGLPTGRVSIRVSAAGFEPASLELDLPDGSTVPVALTLTRERPKRPLLLDVSPESERFASLARRLLEPRHWEREELADPIKVVSRVAGQSDGQPGLSTSSGIGLSNQLLLSFLHDHHVVDALTLPLRLLPVPDGLERRIRHTVLQAWEFHTDARAVEAFVAPVVESRMRLFVLVRAIFLNPLVHELVPTLPDEQVARHLVRCVDSLDASALDVILPFLVQLTDPSMAPVERFVRSLLTFFKVRLPPGSATLRESNVPAVSTARRPPERPTVSLDEISTGSTTEFGVRVMQNVDADERAAAAVFALARLADLIAVAGLAGADTPELERHT